MPAITIFDDSRGAARNRPTSLPAEARSLSRMLRLLDAPQVAAQALSQALEALPPPATKSHGAAIQRVKQQVSQSILEMKEAGWNTVAKKYAEYHMALAVESVLQDPASLHVETTKKNNNLQKAAAVAGGNSSATGSNTTGDDCSSIDASSVVPAPKRANRDGVGSPSSLSSLETRNSSSTSHVKGCAPTTTTTTQQRVSRRAALVSDSSSTEESTVVGVQVVEEEEVTGSVEGDVAEEESTAENDIEVDELVRAGAVRHIWATILESLHLQIASRTTRVWGRKKIYEIYQFAKPIQDASADEMTSIRGRVETECHRILAGVVDVTSACRIYTTMQPMPGANGSNNNLTQAICVQISLGKPLDLHDERNRSASGEKKKKQGGEFVAILIPGSTLFALTASRAPSRARYTAYVLAVLENVLTDTTKIFAAAANKNMSVDDLATTRIGDISGTEPCDLLRSARSLTAGEATGRFANMARKDKSNPIRDLQIATTGNLLVEQNVAEAKRLEIGKMHPGHSEVAVEAGNIAASTNGTAALGAASRTGCSLLVDHTVKEKQSRKRARIQALGEAKDCPSMQRLCWKWSGETSAASMCWLDQDGSKTNNATIDDGEQPPKTEFKCAVVMKGDNVMQGIQALIDAGLMEAPLPDFIRDAPSMGGTIRVDHGSFAAGAGAFEEV